ncbi:MAG TPA: CotH kinase family protein, partial [Kofleriaceae bacterium]|nr:CotH kinase family protein [Kofleriaceae bacterium]
DSNTAPERPEVMAPAPGRIDVIADDLVIRTSAFSDPDEGAAHARTEFEIWRLAAGEPVIRVWHAALDAESGADLTRVSLADGTFEVGVTLDEWADYGIQARYSDGGDCSAYSEWSDLRPFRTDDGSSVWFQQDLIHDVRITIPEASWDPINAQARPPGCVPYVRQYYTGSVEVEGQVLDGVGVRTKGGCGSSRDLSGKASFKINLSWDDPAVEGCPQERRIHGLKRFTLNNSVQDRSFVHEMLAYRFYQLMGVPAPRANHVRVFVNGELWGLYLNLESIDRRFLSRWFDSKDGMLYEGTYWCDLVPANVPPDAEDTYCISRKFHPSACEPLAEGGDPENYTVVRQMVNDLANGYPVGSFYPEIEAIWDFDSFLSLWAVENIIGHWDGYTIQIVNNYRIYHDPSTGKWSIIPTGVDQTFGQNTPIDQVAGLLAQRCWQEQDCQDAYKARLAQAVDVFEQADLQSMAAAIRDQIGPAVMEDPRKEGSYDEMVNGVQATINFIDARPAAVRASLGL